MAKVSYENLKELYKKWHDVNHVIPNLNAGGCAVFAAELGKRLSSIGYSVSAVSVGMKNAYEGNTPAEQVVLKARQNNSGTLKATDLNKQDCQIAHVFLKVNLEDGVLFCDSEGIYENLRATGRWRTYGLSSVMTIEDCDEIASVQEGWNRCFNRKFIPKLKSFLSRSIIPSKQLALNFGQ